MKDDLARKLALALLRGLKQMVSLIEAVLKEKS